tara:strand:- start:15 stop:485 length:471 start_codon:yes stop_codon:yes gene_type:complete
MDDLNKLDFDVSYDADFSKEKTNLIDVYARNEEVVESQKEEDKLISFSADLINCFKDKVKKSSKRLRIDSLIETYKAAEESYDEKMECTLGEWCMANVNKFLNIAEGKQFDLDISAARKDLNHYNLEIDFNSVDELYIETRKEAINNAIASHWMEI